MQVLYLHLAVSRVNDVHDAVEGKRRFGDVRRHHALPQTVGRAMENFGLKFNKEYICENE